MSSSTSCWLACKLKSPMTRYNTDNSHIGQRLDVVATNLISSVSRAAVVKLINEAKIAVNKVPSRASYKIRERDIISVDDSALTLEVPDITLPIIYEDEDCLVINKPTGVLTHSKGNFNPEATVASFIRSHLKDLEGNRAGIVHRLDRATSGVIICAKNQVAQQWLQKQFSKRNVKKTYMAVVSGTPTPTEAIIDIPIGRNPKKPQTFRASPNGKPALTNYSVIARGSSLSLVKLTPQTGRTHQLRVHMKHIGHPILGDELYGGSASDRMYLHAIELEITLPNKKREVFCSPTPDSFNKVIVTS